MQRGGARQALSRYAFTLNADCRVEKLRARENSGENMAQTISPLEIYAVKKRKTLDKFSHKRHRLIMLNANEIIEQLAQNADSTSRLSAHMISQLINYGAIERHAADAVLLAPNERVNKVYVPVDHPLLALDPNTQNIEQRYAIGEIVGLSHALQTARFPYALKALELTTVITLTASNLRSLIDHDPQFRWQVLTYLADNFEKRPEMATNEIARNPAKRLAGILIELASVYGNQTEQGIEIQTKISQDALGARIGTSRQTVNKYLGEFIEQGMIRKSGHRYYVTDIGKLKNFSKSD